MSENVNTNRLLGVVARDDVDEKVKHLVLGHGGGNIALLEMVG
jgi:hypothetical protein